MIKNYFKIAWRNLIKGKGYSAINIGGLAVGMAVALLIGLWIYSELSFNQYHKNYNRIAQVMQHQNYSNEIHTDKAIPIPLSVELRHSFANDFRHIVLSSWTNNHLLTANEKTISQPGNFMEPGAPEMLSLKMIEGSPNGLQDPSSILLSLSLSKTLFGNENAMGKVVKLDSSNLKVSGVYEDLPVNTSLNKLAFIAPWILYAATEENKTAFNDWNQNSFQLFVQVADNRNIADVSTKIKDVKLNATGDKDLKPVVFLHPMSRWHLHAEFKNGVNTGGAIEYVWIFSIIGVFVLLLACINFMNLSTARSEKRAKEVGVRKVIGSSRSQIISQFYTESLLIVFFAFILSILLTQLAIPAFNTITDKRITILWSNALLWLIGIGFSFITAFIAGSYPALYLSSFQPLKVLKGTFKLRQTSTAPRKVLVVIQFTVSVILIVGTITVYRQLQFAKDRPVGYNKSKLIVLRPYSSAYHDHFDAMKADLMQTGVVTSIAESSNTITKSGRTGGGFRWKGKDPGMQDDFNIIGVTADYGSTVGMQFITGRNFSSEFATDSAAIIINEAAVQYMGLRQPVGETITLDKAYSIIGVVKNVITGSPYDPVKPALYFISNEAGYINFRIKAGVNINDALTKIETACKKYSPNEPFDYKFADEEYEAKFNNEQRIGNLATVLAILAIFISCLGLFGLASFVAEQRTKEIGIRKVLGATVFGLWQLLSKEFLVLVLISFLIAAPIAYYFMNNWLMNYEYRTQLSWWVFAFAAIGVIVITIFTVSFQAIKAAIANPIKSLRTE